MEGYRHTFVDGTPIPLPPGKVVCVGRNFADHIAELHNRTPTEPVLFMKPTEALVPIHQPIALPQGLGACHHEIEVAALIGERLGAGTTPGTARAAVAGYALALDLTLRDVQDRLKKQGLPWERAKAFAGSCPISPFVPPEAMGEPEALTFSLTVNGQLRQRGDGRAMIHPLFALIAHIAATFPLSPGDVVLTGTPSGVAALAAGDRLLLDLIGRYRFEARVG